MFKNALVSVSDKSGLVDFLRPLSQEGLRIVSTGGTARLLRESGLTVIDISEQTGFPEVMDGRVKTLHPRVHMSLLAREGNADDGKILRAEGLEPFDLVIGNLYPFEQAQQEGVEGMELVEYIDIGGPSLLRAAAKNFERITAICDPRDYQWVASRATLSLDDRKKLAAKVFAHVSTYDSLISRTLGADMKDPDFSVGGRFVKSLRYGENPQQQASWFSLAGGLSGLHEAQILQGKELSYNNLLDLDAACETLSDLSDSWAAVAVKHNNPCGAAVAETVFEATRKALDADPMSVFGGIVALNGCVDRESAEKLGSLFLECIIAPEFSADACEVLSKKKNLRLLTWKRIGKGQSLERFEKLRTINGGFLVEGADEVNQLQLEKSWQFMGEKPSTKVLRDLFLAWRVCAHLKSNAIALVAGGQTVGLGMGQVNRVDAVKQSIERMRTHHPQSKDVVLASDAFFPFPDSVELAAQAGIKWIVQPGGSIKDEEVKVRAKDLGVHLVFTGRRHFLH